MLPIIVLSQNWISYSSDDKLKIEYCYADCHDKANGINQQKVLLRYSNLTDSTIEINLTITTIYAVNGKEFQTHGDNPKLQLTLLPHQLLEGDCKQKNRVFGFYSKMLDMEASELKNFTIIINGIKLK